MEWVVNAMKAPNHSTPREIIPAPIVRDAECVDPRGRFGPVQKIRPHLPPGFDPQSPSIYPRLTKAWGHIYKLH